MGIDNKLRQTSRGAVCYFGADHLGTTRTLVDASGNVTSSLSYDSFGNVTSGSASTRYTYTGREIDSDIGLMYYRARWYDPQQGRFVSEDPIGLAAGINAHVYVGNNPVVRKDPLGLYDIDVHYYLTYYLALKTGCFSDSEARYIAWGNQDSDESDWKKPGWGNSVVVVGGRPSINGYPYRKMLRQVRFQGYFGCKWIRCNQKCPCNYHKTKVYEDSGRPNWHVERKDCGSETWSSKDSSLPLAEGHQ